MLTAIEVLVAVAIIVLLVLAMVGGTGIFVDQDIAIRALETNGFSNIEIIEKDVYLVRWKGGGEDDVVKFTAVATNPAGKRVKVNVFAGWPFKGATIRTQ